MTRKNARKYVSQDLFIQVDNNVSLLRTDVKTFSDLFKEELIKLKNIVSGEDGNSGIQKDVQLLVERHKTCPVYDMKTLQDKAIGIILAVVVVVPIFTSILVVVIEKLLKAG